MPYINKNRRQELLKAKIKKEIGPCANAGELNYIISTICLDYIKRYGLSYKNINDIIGGLECCKLEFYRRLAASYEDEKIIMNGDIYND